MTATTAKQIPLKKVRPYSTTVELPLGVRRTSDAGWATSEGHAVHRTHDQGGNPQYWVRDRTDRYSLQDTLTDARKRIEWLRKHGR